MATTSNITNTPRKSKQPRIPPQAAVDELVHMPWSAEVPESSFDPFQALDAKKRRFVAAFFANHGSMTMAAKCAQNDFNMTDAAALEHAFIFRSDPMVQDALKRGTDFQLSRRGELFLGALTKAYEIACTDVDSSVRLRAIEFLANNVGSGLENKEAQIAAGGTNGEGNQMKSLVEMISASMTAGAQVGVQVGAAVGVAAGRQAGQAGQVGQVSKMVPIDVKVKEMGNE